MDREVLEQVEGCAGAARRCHDQQTSGMAASLVIDRVTASRMGITPQMIDETLYDALANEKSRRCIRS